MVQPVDSDVSRFVTLAVGLEDRKDQLIEVVEELMPPDRPVPLGPTQLQNLVRMAGETSSVAEVLNFLKYQLGRERGNLRRAEGRLQHGAPNPADQRRADEFRSKVALWEGLIGAINDREALSTPDKGLRILLVRAFLGYLRRQGFFVGYAGSDEQDR